jgi:hypothetical protein
MKYEHLTREDIEEMSAEEIRDLIETDFALFKEGWEENDQDDGEDLRFYKIPDGFDVIVTGGIEDIEDDSY